MFGADTPLVMDALQIVALAAAATGAAVYLMMRRKRVQGAEGSEQPQPKGDLEQRVRVLERIATDRSIDLADEIESLRDAPQSQGANT